MTKADQAKAEKNRQRNEEKNLNSVFMNTEIERRGGMLLHA